MEIRICGGVRCRDMGADFIADDLEALARKAGREQEITVTRTGCMGRCGDGVCVRADGRLFHLYPSDTADFFKTYCNAQTNMVE